MPALARHHQYRVRADVGVALDRLLRGGHDLLLFRPAPGVLGVELLGERLSLVGQSFVGREQQARREIGAGHAAGGVHARRHHEGDVVGVDGLAGQARDVEQRAQADLVRALRELLEAELGDDAVFADERHHVGQRANRGDLHEGLQPALTAGLLTQALHQLQRHAHAGQVLVGIAAVAALRVHDGERLRQFGIGLVMVGDDEIHPEFAGAARRLGGADAAVDRDDDSGAVGVQTLDGGRLQAVAVAQPFGDEVRDVAAEQFERPPQDHRGGDAVDVVVAVHDDPFLAGDGAEQAVDRRRQVGELPRILQVRQRRPQEPIGGFRIVVAADGEQPRHHRRQVELALETRGRGLVAGPRLPDERRRHGVAMPPRGRRGPWRGTSRSAGRAADRRVRLPGRPACARAPRRGAVRRPPDRCGRRPPVP